MMRWRKVWPVLRREYLSRVQTKAFWISTALVPILLVAMMVLPAWFMRRTGGDFRVAVVTADGELAREITERTREHAAARTGPGRMTVTIEPVEPAPDAAAQRLDLKRRVANKELAGIVWRPETGIGTGEVEYLSVNVTAVRLVSELESVVSTAVTKRRLLDAGVARDRLEALTRRVSVRPVRIGEDLRETAEAAFEKSFALSYILTFTVYMTLIFYGYYVMRSVIEEKSSRIVEIIVANLRPMELMVGKIFGVGAVGLTQYLIWVIVAINLGVTGLVAGAAMSAPLVDPKLMIFFVIFFVMGYFQYAALYAAVGAAFNTEEEAQQTQSLMSLILVPSMLLMFPVMASPDAKFAVIVSLIPVFSPVLFFTRMTVQMPPGWQIALCLALMLVSIFVIARFAAAVYRVGILMYGKKPTLGDIWRWSRQG
ncbi:MAG: ABC transporter permease [Thermoanaerobaculaceae bacterium]|nr:ABC transporter permease [Thermoanaerobaculaceae bacterium]MDI9621641.1 ABC transporter permease [Acidobacteriota bacterium]NLH10775.1 ABC transporter permease [Holophagae bacterium]HPW55986.1 ABC transporter permease [Thermoanaerobaculaceae bacterium]